MDALTIFLGLGLFCNVVSIMFYLKEHKARWMLYANVIGCVIFGYCLCEAVNKL